MVWTDALDDQVIRLRSGEKEDEAPGVIAAVSGEPFEVAEAPDNAAERGVLRVALWTVGALLIAVGVVAGTILLRGREQT
jgi:hypothetical protein